MFADILLGQCDHCIGHSRDNRLGVIAMLWNDTFAVEEEEEEEEKKKKNSYLLLQMR